MHTRFALICQVVAFAALSLTSLAQETISASELASRLSTKQQDGTAFIRLKMDVSEQTKTVLQLQIKSRASKSGTDLVYQVLFPKERKGESVLLRRAGTKISGTHFAPPDKTRALAGAQMDESLFGSALSYEDVIDNFFGWSQQAITGTETVDRVNCTILESKPGGGERSGYTSVKTWVDMRRLVPMRIEKYNAGRMVRRIETTRVVTDDKGRAIPANLTVTGPKGVTTELDGSRIKHGVALTDADFTPEGLKELAPPKSAGD